MGYLLIAAAIVFEALSASLYRSALWFRLEAWKRSQAKQK